MKKNNTTRKQLVVVIKKTRSFAKKTEITTQSRQNTTAANSTAANYPNAPSAGLDNVRLSSPEPGQTGAPAPAASQPTPPAAPLATTVPPLPKFNAPRAETATPPSVPPVQPSTSSTPQPSLPSPAPAPIAAASAAEPPTAQEPATPPFAPDYTAVGNQLSKLMSGMAAPLSRLAGSFQSFAHATNQSLLKPAQSVAPKTEPKPVTPAPTTAKPISLPIAPAQKISTPAPSGKTGTVQRALATGAAYKQGDIAGLDDAHTRALVASTAATESAGGKLDIRNSAGYLGRYQAGASWLADAGLIAGGANAVIAAMKTDGFTNEYKWGKSGGMTRFLKNKNNWKNGLDYDKYLSSAETQDTAFKTNSDKAYKQLLKEGTIKPNMSQDEIAGILKARHIGGIGGARKAAKGIKGPTDVNGTSALKYKNDLAAGNVFIESYQSTKPKKEEIIDTSPNNESPPKREFTYKKYDYALTDALNKQMALDGSSKATYGNYGAVTRSTVKGYMDPQKNMNETSIYQFLDLTASAELPEKTIKEVLQGKGSLSGKEKVFIDAAKNNSINEAYLVAHALVETGNGESRFAKGELTMKGKKIYNMYGIHVFPQNPEAGIKFAYDQKWFSVDEAIKGGAKWIADNYFNKEMGQKTLYDMRWNPQKPATHQYATAINWATDQSIHMKKMMDKFPNAKLKFEIPEYNK
ncbi:N-acetylglucosaminidase [Dickeya solani]|uniref:Glucosaminidase domain-containing protein n=1 Tax=Dickeya solani TaxID=1089444 RepID=A0ABU4EHV8_9GAMM|nr:N-acetylglucosaminidase [Dickeya solani]MCA6999218.1 glucosaminidase domain-containing protein [Dickeya solani]MCZ0820400.1 glucosaminidase domain-containing protein [Dickeya solani]MDV6995950.1 glucosaminidase domain-containing protein [Dickeya solani]MDV7005655.1 glucosaminidase domain-containing protein [Dickeya solani]MDV7037305.1 glucosaminidase domain-containing protein [Dickeya solani]